MCYFRLYIFLGCGHSKSSTMPVSFCATATDAAKTTTENQEELSPAGQVAEVDTIDSKIDDDAISQADTIEGVHDSLPAAQLAEHDASKPEGPRRKIAKPSRNPRLKPCDEGRVHPLHTVKLDRVCVDCAFERDERLRVLDSSTTEIRIEPKRWQEKRPGKVFIYTSPEKEESNRGSAGSLAGIASLLGQRIDSGVWTGAKWMRDWKGGG
jgi:hypothetical protein